VHFSSYLAIFIISIHTLLRAVVVLDYIILLDFPGGNYFYHMVFLCLRLSKSNCKWVYEINRVVLLEKLHDIYIDTEVLEEADQVMKEIGQAQLKKQTIYGTVNKIVRIISVVRQWIKI